jgi:hypothetical protein
MTPNDFLKLIQEEAFIVQQIPDGWHCSEDLAEMWGVGRTCVKKRICIGLKLGYVTQKKFRVNKNGIRSIPYFKFHEKENNQKVNKRENMENIVRPRRKN